MGAGAGGAGGGGGGGGAKSNAPPAGAGVPNQIVPVGDGQVVVDADGTCVTLVTLIDLFLSFSWNRHLLETICITISKRSRIHYFLFPQIK